MTTRAADEKNLTAREYPLAPLGGNIDPQSLSVGLVGLTSGHWKDVDGEGGEFVAVSPQSITIRQTRTVHAELPSLFDQVSDGEGGSIMTFGTSLLVRQNATAHAKIAKFLN